MSSITTSVDGQGAHALEHAHHDPNLQHHFATKEQQFDTAKIGMWLFLATEILMFGGLFAGFAYMQSRFHEAFYEGHKHLQQSLGALNTIVLLVSSFTMDGGSQSGQNKQKQLITYVVITMVCAFIFLTVKYFEYAHKFRDGGDFSGDYYSPVDLVGLYWHLVDIIWIYLFPLLYLIR